MKTSLLIMFALLLQVTAADNPSPTGGDEAPRLATAKFMLQETKAQLDDAVADLFDRWWVEQDADSVIEVKSRARSQLRGLRSVCVPAEV